MIAEERIDEATDWFLRVHSENGNAEDLVPLRKWLQAHPDNAAAYRQVCATWAAIDDVASSPEIMAGRRDALDHAYRARQRRRRSDRSMRRWQTLAASVVGIGLIALLIVWMTGSSGEVYETGVGERRVLTLADGSLVTLDARTRIEVLYTHETRAIKLTAGQANFKVSRNPARPFRVSLHGQTVVALGTEFNVDVMTDKVTVTLIEGRVAVVPDSISQTSEAANSGSVQPPVAVPTPESRPLGASWQSRVIELSPGQQLLSAGGRPTEIRSQVDLGRAVAWQSGKIFFDDEPLVNAVPRINRYATSQIEVDPSVEDIRISGTFNTSDIDAFIDAVSTYFPVNAVPVETGAIRLTARDGP